MHAQACMEARGQFIGVVVRLGSGKCHNSLSCLADLLLFLLLLNFMAH